MPVSGSSPKVETFYNFDFDNLVTPINPNKLGDLLSETGYDANEIQFLVKGFSEGFDIGYKGIEERQDVSNNIPLKVGSKIELWEKIMKEVKLKRVAGPFNDIPFKNFIQSPVRLVPKAGGKTRMIFHLSYNFKDSGNLSLNACTLPDKCSVKYEDIEFVIRTCFRWAKIETRGVRTIVFAKTDVQSTFRLLPLKKHCWHLLLFKAVDPVSNTVKFFFEKN